MTAWTVLYHYNAEKLLGVWVSQGSETPHSRYFSQDPDDAASGALTVIGDKMPEVSWDDHMDAIGDRLPTRTAWWVGDVIVQDDPPDIVAVAAQAKAEDDRLHGR